MPKEAFSFAYAIELLRDGVSVRPVGAEPADLFISLNHQENRLDLYHGDKLMHENIAPNWSLINSRWERYRYIEPED